MGVEFAHLLIPRDNTTLAAPGSIGDLFESWRGEGFAPTPGSRSHALLGYHSRDRPASLAKWGYSLAAEGEGDLDPQSGDPAADLAALSGREFLLRAPCVGPVEAGLAFPFDVPPALDLHYDLEILVSPELIYMADECIGPLRTACECGEQLEFSMGDEDLFEASRIRANCPRCGRLFRPEDQSVDYRHPLTAEVTPLRGGACFHFAVRIRAGKALNPLRQFGHLPRAAPAFLDLCQRALGQPLYEVGYLY